MAKKARHHPNKWVRFFVNRLFGGKGSFIIVVISYFSDSALRRLRQRKENFPDRLRLTRLTSRLTPIESVSRSHQRVQRHNVSETHLI
jgi:hypothetical protein